MLYTVCSCGEILGNKQLVYEKEMIKICNELGLDFDTISQGQVDQNDEYKIRRSAVINKLCRRWCCKQQMATYVDIVHIIKG
jgi:hypothetical protein